MSTDELGGYRVHPAAALFPALEGQEYEALKHSIETGGQRNPIWVQGDTLLDGRNRLRACLDLNIKPIVREYEGDAPAQLICDQNINRRDLTDELRALIKAQIDGLIVRERNLTKQIEAGKTQGEHGKEGGRGRKKPLCPDSGTGVSKRDWSKVHTNSTVGQIATEAKVSRHKAAQAVAVAKEPDLAQDVHEGKLKLKDAARVAKQRKPAKPKPHKHGATRTNLLRGEKMRVESMLPYMRGIVRAMSEIDYVILADALTEEEARYAVETAWQVHRAFRVFAEQ